MMGCVASGYHFFAGNKKPVEPFLTDGRCRMWCAALVTLPFLAAVHFDSDDFRMRPSTSLRAKRPNWKQAISSPPPASAGLAKLT